MISMDGRGRCEVGQKVRYPLHKEKERRRPDPPYSSHDKEAARSPKDPVREKRYYQTVGILAQILEQKGTMLDGGTLRRQERVDEITLQKS